MKKLLLPLLYLTSSSVFASAFLGCYEVDPNSLKIVNAIETKVELKGTVGSKEIKNKDYPVFVLDDKKPTYDKFQATCVNKTSGKYRALVAATVDGAGPYMLDDSGKTGFEGVDLNSAVSLALNSQIFRSYINSAKSGGSHFFKDIDRASVEISVGREKTKLNKVITERKDIYKAFLQLHSWLMMEGIKNEDAANAALYIIRYQHQDGIDGHFNDIFRNHYWITSLITDSNSREVNLIISQDKGGIRIKEEMSMILKGFLSGDGSDIYEAKSLGLFSTDTVITNKVAITDKNLADVKLTNTIYNMSINIGTLTKGENSRLLQVVSKNTIVNPLSDIPTGGNKDIWNFK